MSWEPTSYQELATALASGDITESDTIEFKETITNEKLARSIASLSIDGGTLLIGVADDGTLKPQTTEGWTEKVANVAWTRIEPGVSPRVWILDDPNTASLGVVVVVVDASPQAPHMTANRYPARRGSTTGYLTDPEVERLMRRRQSANRDATEELDTYRQRDPAPDGPTAHLFVVAVPRLAPPDLLVRSAGGALGQAWLMNEVVLPVSSDDRITAHWYPKVGTEISTAATRGDGMAFVNALDESRSPTDNDPASAAEVEFAQNGTVRIYSARASAAIPSTGQPFLFAGTCVGLTMQALLLAARIRNTAQYNGPWACGITVTNLDGKPAHEHWTSGLTKVFPDTEYTEIYSATAGEMDHPERVGWQLLGRFLRALSLDRYDYSGYGLPQPAENREVIARHDPNRKRT